VSNDALISAFDEEMLGIYERALSEAHYKCDALSDYAT